MPEKFMYLVRHGETVWNSEDRIQGIKDSPLTEKGINHAIETGKKIITSGIVFSQFYTSDLGRAVSTAEYIGKGINMEAVKDTRLRERNMGIFEGKSWEYIKTNYYGEFKAAISGNDNYVIPEGESRGEYARKVSSFLEYVKNESGEGNVLAVTHRGFINFALRNVLGIPLDAKSGFVIKNTTLTVFVLRKGLWMLESFTDTA